MDDLVESLVASGDAAQTLDSSEIRQALLDETYGPSIAAFLIESPQRRRPVASVFHDFPAPSSPHAPWWVAVASTLEIDAIDEQIDAWLADSQRAPAAIEALLRAQTDWYHPAIADHVLDSKSQFGAIWLLARSAPDELEDVLAGIDDADHLAKLLRIAALSAGPQWFDILVEWRQQLLDSLSNGARHLLDGAIAGVDPHRYARRVLGGELDAGWLADDRTVADFITAHGTSEWVIPLAIFRDIRDLAAFETCASFATAAPLTEPFDAIDEQRLHPDEASQWIGDDPRRVAYPLAIAEDEEMAERLVASTLHQTLLQRGIDPPAISGLPFSGHTPDPANLEALIEPLLASTDDGPAQRVARLFSLTQLVTLARNGKLPRATVRTIVARFAEGNDGAKRLLSAFDDDQSIGRFGDWGCRGLETAMWQMQRPPAEAIGPLARQWFFGPPERIPVARAALATLLPAS